jgi:DNA-binding Xre family transcriptional regulator
MKLRLHLAAWRHHRGLSQRQLAAVAGIPQETIARIESGPVRQWHISTVERLAKALECSPESLYFDPE